MIISEHVTDKYLKIKPETVKDNQTLKKILGRKSKTSDGSFLIENSIINNIILGVYNYTPLNNVRLIHSEHLKDYQKIDVLKMISNNSFLNLNKMGYGKTIEMISVLRELDVKNAVIVAPKVILYQWKEQLIKWWSQSESRIVIIEKPEDIVSENSIVLVNYEKLIRTSYMYKINKWVWDVLILDEAHKIKNRTSKISAAVENIPTIRKYAMTGTPILNRPNDLWNLLHFLGPKYSCISYWDFLYYFCDIQEGPFGKKINGITKNKERSLLLHDLISKISCINKDLNLTIGKEIENISLIMSAKQRELYIKTKNLLLDEIPDNMTIANSAVLGLRLQQITSTPKKFINNYGIKFEYILNILNNNPDEKIVVFSKFAETCKYLQKFLNKEKIKSTVYTGDLTSEEKYTSKNAFINEKDCRVIIGTIGAMGVGVDGLQYVSHIAIFIDRDWSPAINQQAEDRLNRIGQKELVIIQYLECKGTYDKYVGRVNNDKDKSIKQILESEDDYT